MLLFQFAIKPESVFSMVTYHQNIRGLKSEILACPEAATPKVKKSMACNRPPREEYIRDNFQVGRIVRVLLYLSGVGERGG